VLYRVISKQETRGPPHNLLLFVLDTTALVGEADKVPYEAFHRLGHLVLLRGRMHILRILAVLALSVQALVDVHSYRVVPWW
jgi:hypothetical protein